MKRLYFFLFIICSPYLLIAQGWEKRFDENSYFNDIAKLKDGYMMLKSEYSGGTFLLKTNLNGDSVTQKMLPFQMMAANLISTYDNGIAVGGNYYQNPKGYVPVIVKTNQQGDTLWSRKININYNGYTSGHSIAQGPDSSLYFFGQSHFDSLYVTKFKKNGQFVWQQKWQADIPSNVNLRPISISYMNDGGLLIVNQFSGNTSSVHLTKLSGTGSVVWEKSEPFITYAASVSSTLTSDGGFVIVAALQSQGSILIKYDASGNKLWNKNYNYLGRIHLYSVLESSDKGFIFSGGKINGTHNADTLANLYFFKINPAGDTIWSRTLEKPAYYSYTNTGGIVESDDLGFVVAGGNGGAFILKMDINGIVFGNSISGKLFEDANENCIQDNGEKPLSNWIVKLLPDNRYTLTDADGNYRFMVNKGSFSIQPIVKHSLYSLNCPSGPKAVSFNALSQTSSGNDFAIKAELCALPKVGISSTLMRRCFRGMYYVNYSNEGTVAIADGQVKVKFPAEIIPLSSTPAWTSKVGNVYFFNVGDIQPGKGGQITITDSVSCLAPLGSTHCVEATINPFSFCETPDPSWDKSSVKVEGSCLSGSVTSFTITNTGEDGDGDMDGASTFRVYFDNVLDSNGTFQLNGGEVLQLTISSRGKTVRVEADQRPGHPGHSRPRATVEGCDAPFLGIATTVAHDDADDFIEIACGQIVGSFDPNDKSVSPIGITENNYIPTGAELEYLIRFQNTGSDTAFTVVIRDALSNYLDVSTLKLEATSHPCSYKIVSGEREVVEFRFNNILLPDSNVNEPKSHGFVRFKIKQNANLPLKAVIENDAAIYFDYNDPVITNTTRSVVFDTTMLGARLTGLIKPYKKEAHISTYPNPFNDRAKIEISGSYSSVDVVVMDITGKVCKEMNDQNTTNLTIDREGLLEGMYFIKIYSAGELIGSGKLVVVR